MVNIKAKVLGVTYKIITNATVKDYPRLREADGYCDFTTKEIVISEMEPTEDTWQKMEVYENRTIRHELVHAFLFESGLDHNTEWARNEEIVDWIAIQFPKLSEVFKKLEF